MVQYVHRSTEVVMTYRLGMGTLQSNIEIEIKRTPGGVAGIQQNGK